MEASGSAYILVEAVNIDSTVFDTGHISVIRGGSYLLARAIQTVARHKGLGKGLKALSIGGSSGLFRVENQIDATDRAHHIARYLRSHSRYRLFPFAVEHVRAPDPATARTMLSARMRFRQLRQLTQAPDAKAVGPFDRACAFNGRRGAYSHLITTIGDEALSLSRSVHRRLWWGRRLRGALYFDLLRPTDWPAGAAPAEIAALYERLADYALSDNLEQLSHCERFRVLSGKIAVIHVDGNGFGALQAAHSGSDEEQIQFDRTVRGKRAEALAQILQGYVPSKAGEAELLEAVIPAAEAKQQRPVLRLETLLWGGDEMTLVVPAWLGFDLLFQLFASLGRETTDLDGTAMTHAAGIVFCHANTPIARMRELAQRLCDSVKARFDPAQPAPNGFDYLVLESIDYPVEKTLNDFFETRYDKNNAVHRTDLAPSARWGDRLRPALKCLIGAEVLARSQVYHLARRVRFEDHRTLFGNQPAGALPWSMDPDESATTAAMAQPSPFEQDEARMIRLAKDRAPAETVNADLATLADFFRANSNDQRTRAWLWLHLTELWDYLLPERDHQAQELSS